MQGFFLFFRDASRWISTLISTPNINHLFIQTIIYGDDFKSFYFFQKDNLKSKIEL